MSGERLGVVIIGLNGAVSSTIVAGTRLMVRGAAKSRGMLTEPSESTAEGQLHQLLNFAPLSGVVFAGWDIHDRSLHEAAIGHGVFRVDQLAPVEEDLKAIRPWPAVFDSAYARNLSGKHVVTSDTFRGQIKLIREQIEAFKAANKLDRVVMVNVASTEKWLEPTPAYESLSAFESAIDANDPAVSPTMRYFYAAQELGIPHANFAPSLAMVPAMVEHAEKNKTPFAGMDGKTGQTLVKTALASMFRARNLTVDGWYSTNFLGNNDGLVLNSPDSNKTKVMSKASVLDSILGYKVENHQVHIHYYKPRGDAKEAWDNIDIIGFADIPMQMKVNFLCQDSALAAPLIIDLFRILDVAKQAGESGIQRQLSFFFKSPYANPGEIPEHDLFTQERDLYSWANTVKNSGRLK